MDPWHLIRNVDEVNSPALLIYPDRVEENIRRMTAYIGNVDRLRPHIKTHKLPEILTLEMKRGISKFKCATIAETEMAANGGAADLLLAYQPVGPNVRRFLELQTRFPGTKFSTVADDAGAIRALSSACAAAGTKAEVLLDIDCGQHRTGISSGAEAIALYRLLHTLPGLTAGGLHVYDGHIHDADPAVRKSHWEAAFAPVDRFRRELLAAGLAVPRVVAGGTPTFPILAKRDDVECSPGTCVFWDAGYARKLPDMDFLNAALVLTRVISKPGTNRLCLDLGHKAIASENPPPRVQFIKLPEAKAVTHSEEHLVIETAEAATFNVGDSLYGIPWHICPTVALHSEAVVIENGCATQRWKIVGRERRLTI